MFQPLEPQVIYIAETLPKLYHQWGLEHAMSFLLTCLQGTGHILDVHCGLLNRKELSYFPISFVGEDGAIFFTRENTYQLGEIPYSPIFSAEDSNSLENKIMDGKFVQAWQKIPMEVSKEYHKYSFLRTTILKLPWHDLCFGVTSEQPQCFDNFDLSFFHNLVTPLGEAMVPSLTDGNMAIQDTWLTLTQEGKSLLKICKGLKGILADIDKVASKNTTLLLTGETGTGKSLLARYTHRLSHRKDNPFVHVNCGSIPEELIDSELFGHERGAFTGAINAKPGLFEQAANGTIFLDEIAELSLSNQTHLLHALDTLEARRVGGSRSYKISARVLAATHQDLESMVEQGKFRQDLYYRLCVFPIYIPPLYLRRMDIVPLLHYFIVKKSAELGRYDIPIISAAEIEKALTYRWPGNVRELEHLIERSLLKMPVGSKELKLYFPIKNNLDKNENPQESWQTLQEYTDTYIKKVLEKTNYKVFGEDGAANILNIHPSTLRSKMGKLGLNSPKKWRDSD